MHIVRETFAPLLAGRNPMDREGHQALFDTIPYNYNAKGALIAWNVADLHGDVQRDRNSVNKEFALNEKGLPVNGRGDTPNQHDILTGSDSFGRTLLGTAANTTCNNWASNAAGSAMVPS